MLVTTTQERLSGSRCRLGADSRGLKETKQVLDGGPRFKRGKEAMNPQTWPQTTPGEAGRLVPLESRKPFSNRGSAPELDGELTALRQIPS